MLRVLGHLMIGIITFVPRITQNDNLLKYKKVCLTIVDDLMMKK